MNFSDMIAQMGNCQEMFEQVDGNNYQKVCFYVLRNQTVGTLWFDRDDRLTLVYLAILALNSL